jgi:hypothetical protein
MRSLAFAVVAATALVAGAASTASASPAGSALPNVPAAQSSADQVHYRRNCYWRHGHWHCDRGRHYGWYRERPYRHWRHYRYYRDRY